ncbi:hypothetical protein ACFV3N_16920 [Streptomyces bauhiniae]|uniref:hypothetical protein n=1 Tax=Streptomyces bauhiniae TaxID=2340725 RepID=UPI00365434A2
MGLSALAILGPRCAAAIEDPLASSGVLYFFTPPGTSDTWSVENTRALTPGTTIPVPPARRTEGPGAHWRVCPGEKGWLTDPGALEAAIGDAFGPRVGEERPA